MEILVCFELSVQKGDQRTHYICLPVHSYAVNNSRPMNVMWYWEYALQCWSSPVRVRI